MFASQPLDRHVPVDADLRGAWLGRSVAHHNLGVDASPAGDDLTPVGAPVAERVGANFDGAADYLRRAEADWQPDSLGTILAWIKLDVIGAYQTIFASCDEATALQFYWVFQVRNNNLLRVYVIENGVTLTRVVSTTALVADRWYRVGLVSDGSAYEFYLDGVSDGAVVEAVANTGDWLGSVTQRDNVTTGAARYNAVATHFNGQIKDVQYLSRCLSADEMLLDYQLVVPDDDLVLWTWGGMTDLTRFVRTPTHYGDVAVGYEMWFDGTDDRIDWGDLGNVQAISEWLQIGSANEQVLQIDAGKHIAFAGGTIQYTGVTPVATYVNGVPGGATVLGTDRWYHLVAVFEQEDANNFELGWDGSNYGDTKQQDVRVFNRVPIADEVAELYAQLRRAH